MKGLEEIQGTIQTWGHAFSEKFKRKLSKKEFISFLEETKAQLELKTMREQFSNWKPEEIDLMIKEVKNSTSENFKENAKVK